MLPVLTRWTGHLLWRARMRVVAELATALPAGVDVHAYAALHVLADDAPRSQAELAEATAVSRTTVGAVATELVRHGLVARVRNPDDRRSWLLTRTPDGAAATREWAGHVDRAAARLTAPLGDDADGLRALLHAVADPLLSPSVPPVLRASTGFLVTRVHEHAHRDFLHALAPLGLEPRHVGALVVLGETGPVPQADLARHLGLSGARVVQLVDGLERHGLVSRHAAPGDRRTHLLHLEPGAPDALAGARELGRPRMDALLAPLGPDDRERLCALLVRLVS